MNIEQELAAARDVNGPVLGIYPSLKLRMQLAQFALTHGLPNEGRAAEVVMARFFRMVESERWAGWFAEEDPS